MLESELEKVFLEKLRDMGYIYRRDITTIEALNQNFKEQLEFWNKITLSQSELKRILRDITGKGVFESTKILHDKYTLLRDDGTGLNISLYDTKNWCQNTFEVINQLKYGDDAFNHRYDVHILINGIPMVHIELKNEFISPERALVQIARYKDEQKPTLRTSLLGFVQIFIVSNNSLTFYFVNNERLDFQKSAQFIPVFMWADENNNKLNHLIARFAPSFLEKCFLSRMISRFIVQVNTRQELMILRPYQVHAVERIIRQVNESYGNGYIWHTTGSGKTLTSFKCATVLKENENIHKVLFVVDRKDLDKQTVREFNLFEEGCVDETSNTGHLLEKLTNPSVKIIVTTLQKLNRLLDNYRPDVQHLGDKKKVFIFDECHRSQFGESNKKIRDTFKNIQMFGFTGTPIFAENSKKMFTRDYKTKKITTEDIFGEQLHSYLISHAIEDNNVLRFHIDYFDTADNTDYSTPSWKQAVADKILKDHGRSTVNRQFNAILTTASIKDAIEYYRIFAEAQKNAEDKLNIACIFSPPPSIKLDLQEDLEAEKDEYARDSAAQNAKKEALEGIMADYNAAYGKSFKLESADNTNNFIGYYGDIADRMKAHRQIRTELSPRSAIDVLIVVDMFLTGFDSKFINTMYIDKNLEYHGLIQAFSRTNRTYNALKDQGNIICFRNLKEKVDEAIKLFSRPEHEESESYWETKSALELANDFAAQTESLKQVFSARGLDFNPASVANLDHKEEFHAEFQKLVRLKNTAAQYTLDDMSALAEVFPEAQYKAFHRAFIESKKTPFAKEAPKARLPPRPRKSTWSSSIRISSIKTTSINLSLTASFREALK